MSPETIGILGIVLLLLLLCMRMWIGTAMIFVGFVGYTYISGVDSAIQTSISTIYASVSNYNLTAVPLFVLMGMTVSNTRIGGDLYECAYTIFGHLRSGLAIATVTACGIFAAICGSSTAETLTIGKIALSEMKKYDYSDTLSTGCVAAGGTIGILIPPSMGFLLYGIITEQSVGILFMAGILPGIILLLFFMATILIISIIDPKAGPAGKSSTLMEKVASTKYTIPIIILFIIVLGGIYMGVFTPTEAGAIGAFGAIVISLIKGDLKRHNLYEAIYETAVLTSMIILLLSGANILNKFLTITDLPFGLAEFVVGLDVNKYIVLALIVLFYMILGMFLDILSCIILTVPIIFPLVTSLGFDPIWFGVLIVLIMEMGMITPPFGFNVFILSSITDVPIETIYKGILPFVGAILACVVLITVFPQIVMLIPSLM